MRGGDSYCNVGGGCGSVHELGNGGEGDCNNDICGYGDSADNDDGGSGRCKRVVVVVRVVVVRVVVVVLMGVMVTYEEVVMVEVVIMV